MSAGIFANRTDSGSPLGCFQTQIIYKQLLAAGSCFNGTGDEDRPAFTMSYNYVGLPLGSPAWI